MTSNDLVSIIIPTLNEKDNLKQIILSILGQTYYPIEVIIVDGGSSDGTRKLLQTCKDNLISASIKLKILWEEEFEGIMNPAHARNIGIKASLGEYVILLDADTRFIDCYSVSKLKHLLETNDFVRVKAKIQIDTKLEEQISFTHSPYYHCGYRKRLFDKIFFDERLVYGEDRDLWFRIKKNLNVDLYTTEETLLIRHLPHKYKDFFAQSIWYAKSYTNFVNSVLEKGNLVYLDEIANTFLGFLFSLYLPLFFIISFFKDFNTVKKIDFRFFSINFMRRCLFLFYLAKSSFNKKSLKAYINCMALWLFDRIDKLHVR